MKKKSNPNGEISCTVTTEIYHMTEISQTWHPIVISTGDVSVAGQTDHKAVSFC